jgi:hypothetical protein
MLRHQFESERAALARLHGQLSISIPQIVFEGERSGWPSFGQKTDLTAFSCGLLMIITQEPTQSVAALDAPLSIEVTVPRK